MIKVLIITLYSGENEYNQCCQSVEEQQGFIIEHKIIKDLPKQEAHQKLYKNFNNNRSNFDYFAKLDADMAFSNPNALNNILQNFNKDVDIVSATVHDGITNSDMQSFNVFSSRCYFKFDTNDPLFTDSLEIEYEGQQVSYVDVERNVLHAFNPSPFQAFMFGVHRSLKVVQPGTKIPKINSSYHQLRILNQAYLNYKRTGSVHAKNALLGATLVFQGLIETQALYQKKDYIDVFEKYVIQEELDYIDPRLSTRKFISLHKILGKKRFFKGTFHILIKKLRIVNKHN
tara:strand:+ start:22213 stop:23073 length:861 start_codon:yes stop_codon:yes gene_type:complete